MIKLEDRYGSLIVTDRDGREHIWVRFEDARSNLREERQDLLSEIIGDVEKLDFEDLLAPSIHTPITHQNIRPDSIEILDIPAQAKYMKDKVLQILKGRME